MNTNTNTNTNMGIETLNEYLDTLDRYYLCTGFINGLSGTEITRVEAVQLVTGLGGSIGPSGIELRANEAQLGFLSLFESGIGIMVAKHEGSHVVKPIMGGRGRMIDLITGMWL